MIARVIAVAVTTSGVAGCALFGPDPEVASLPPVFGARVADGQLQLWTGTRCSDVSRTVVTFSPGAARLVLGPAAGKPVAIENLLLSGPYTGLKIAEPLPAGFDWRKSKTVLLLVDSKTGGAGSTPTDVAEIVGGSPQHPGAYYFQGIGWLDSAQAAEQDGKTLLLPCTPDPKK
jgi:hypothetical protein